MLTTNNKKLLVRHTASLLASVALIISSIAPVSASENEELKLIDVVPVFEFLMKSDEQQILICNPFPECQISEMDNVLEKDETQNSSNIEQENLD